LEIPNPKFPAYRQAGKIQISSDYQFPNLSGSFLWSDFISFGHWSIEYYLGIGACLPAGRQGIWLLK